MNVMHYLMGQVRHLFGTGARLVVLLIAGLLSMPAHVEALGFGAISLTSHLNQALKADIPMLLNDADDMKTVRVALATPQEYRQLGLQWQPELSHIRVLMLNKFSAQPMLQLRSAGLIQTPMISIVLKAKKSGRGTYFKHYKLLFDPAERSLKSKQKASSSALAFQTLSADGQLPSTDGWARTWRYGPVQAGDSLSEIAYRLRVDKRFSNKQVMLSLYENNADAFIKGNINHLIKGAWLTVPSADVVKKAAGNVPLQRLSKLLERKNPSAKVEETGVKKAPAAGKSIATSNTGQAALRYSGKIALDVPSTVDASNAVAELKQGMDTRFDNIHQEMMQGKLQMASFDETISNLNLSMQGVKDDLHRLQKDIETIKQRTESFSRNNDDLLMSWQFALIVVLFIALIGALVMLMLQKRKVVEKAKPVSELEREPDSNHQLLKDQRVNDVSPMKKNDSTQGPLKEKPEDVGRTQVNQESPALSDEVIQLLNQIEEKLGECEFEQAEKLLHDVDVQCPDSLKASALRAQLYHETDRHDERNDLINSISEASDEQRWERFCYFLPSHVWNACFGESVAPDNS